MSYHHYTGFELKIGNKMVTEILQCGKNVRIIHIFVTVFKNVHHTLCIITMNFVHFRCTKSRSVQNCCSVRT